MIINNAKIITFDEENNIIENGGILINEDGNIAKVFTTTDIDSANEQEDVIDANGQILMPGSICAHTHFYGAYSRGMYIPGEAPDAFPQILEKLWWRLDKALDKDSVYFSAMVCLIDAIRHGTTTLFDHHASPNYIKNSLDTVADAVLKSGLRASLCYEVTDRDGLYKSDEGIAENVRFIQDYSKLDSSRERLNATFGLHASLPLSGETLKKVKSALPDNIGIHIHVAEHPVDEYDSINKSGMRVVDRLNSYGLLGEKTIFAHGVHIDHKEAEIILENGVWLTHQPRSNMNNAVGLGNIESFLRAGMKICLGNDGFSNSSWAEWRAAYLGHKSYAGDPRRMPANLIQRMAIMNNRKLVENQFNGLKLGAIKKGYKADLILVDYDPFTEITKDNLPWHIVFGFKDGMVSTTIVDGKILMRNRVVTILDEKSILAEARKLHKSVWKRYHNYFE